MDDDECETEKPETEKPCELRPCEGVDWVTSAWSGVRQFYFHVYLHVILFNIVLFSISVVIVIWTSKLDKWFVQMPKENYMILNFVKNQNTQRQLEIALLLMNASTNGMQVNGVRYTKISMHYFERYKMIFNMLLKCLVLIKMQCWSTN